MSDYRFDFNQADAVLYDMDQHTKRINSALDEMEKSVEARMQDWDGAAKEQYAVSKAVWDQSAKEMGVFLDQARLTLLQISDNYGTTEQRQAQIWNDVRGG
ncbi:WXG100 family type VII secretion target [Actinoplanes solisilvae]|uniref:WXG100 family type VII secretion target n=1 Tax=Actinoplanes solisilvae TaxID=2486853 RepID=UPI000FD70960|nr:WXG100 family type VII secretion target [Actinoplanes solisilvae]